MGITPFDSLVNVVGAWTTRRSALSLIAAFGLSNLSLTEGDAAQSGRCKPKCDECRKCDKGECHKNHEGKKFCKKGKCKPRAFGTPCTIPGGGSCQDGICGCAAGLTNCSSSCRNLKTDEANCGTCGIECAATQICQEGSCFPKSICSAAAPSLCTPPATDCGPACRCGTSTEGNIICFELGASFCSAPTCATSANCLPGLACVDAGGCCGPPPLPAGSNRCLPPCSAPSA